jgi:hypothetical protein
VVGALATKLPLGNSAQLRVHQRKQVIHGHPTSPQSYGVCLHRLNVPVVFPPMHRVVSRFGAVFGFF